MNTLTTTEIPNCTATDRITRSDTRTILSGDDGGDVTLIFVSYRDRVNERALVRRI